MEEPPARQGRWPRCSMQSNMKNMKSWSGREHPAWFSRPMCVRLLRKPRVDLVQAQQFGLSVVHMSPSAVELPPLESATRRLAALEDHIVACDRRCKPPHLPSHEVIASSGHCVDAPDDHNIDDQGTHTTTTEEPATSNVDNGGTAHDYDDAAGRQAPLRRTRSLR
eukprot:Polyplicarium_translucidae@DN1371_c0_g1_i2.p1